MSWRNRNFSHVLGIDRSLGLWGGQGLVLEPRKEAGRVSNPEAFMVSVKQESCSKGCGEAETDFICPLDFSLLSPLCLLRRGLGGHLYCCPWKTSHGPSSFGLPRHKDHLLDKDICAGSVYRSCTNFFKGSASHGLMGSSWDRAKSGARSLRRQVGRRCCSGLGDEFLRSLMVMAIFTRGGTPTEPEITSKGRAPCSTCCPH